MATLEKDGKSFDFKKGERKATSVRRPNGIRLVAMPLVSSDKPKLIREGLGKYEPNMPDFMRHLD